jgi:Ca-activated chloride channel family protein
MDRQQKTALVFAILGTVTAWGAWFFSKDRFQYADEWVFWLLLTVPILGIYEVWSAGRSNPKVKLSAFSQFGGFTEGYSHILVQLPFLFRSVGLAVLIIALARPQSQLSWRDVSTEGIDIVVAMDISASMLAKDFDPNRLESAKEVAIEFIEERPNDRIGLVVYEGESFTQCPLTTDHSVLTSLFKDVKTGMVQGGTAIGMGLATSVNRLRDSEARSKVVILLTDGENNAGSVSPVTAAEIAQQYGVRVYTIGVGSKGRALSPIAIYPDGRYKYDYVDVKINEESLQEIANITGGEYFRATNGKALANIYSEIDRLEKTKINVTEHSRKSEEFFWFAVIGSGLLLLEFLFRELIIQKLP